MARRADDSTRGPPPSGRERLPRPRGGSSATRFVRGLAPLHGRNAGAPRVAGGAEPPRVVRVGRAQRVPSGACRRVRRRRARDRFDEDAVRGRGAQVHRARERASRRAKPRPYQAEALEAWRRSRARGVVVLPTGAGKSHVAVLAIAEKKRSTLVVAPTLDLVRQWYDLLTTTFGGPVGVLGGGEHDVQSLTVSTYDSLHLHAEHLGARFGLIVFDECHHLPSTAYALAARACIAPFRLGLTATPERADAREIELDAAHRPHRLPEGHRRAVGRLPRGVRDRACVGDARAGGARAPRRRAGDLPRLRDASRDPDDGAVGVGGVRDARPRGAKRGGGQWRPTGSSERSRSRRLQSSITWSTSCTFTGTIAPSCSPRTTRPPTRLRAAFSSRCITHKTKVRERSALLAGLAAGTYRAIATSKVLNEGVDVPDANVAVILSGSGTVREHVQRLGRILRKKGRQARGALRARDRGDDRDVYERLTEGAQCLPLTSCNARRRGEEPPPRPSRRGREQGARKRSRGC